MREQSRKEKTQDQEDRAHPVRREIREFQDGCGQAAEHQARLEQRDNRREIQKKKKIDRFDHTKNYV